MRTASTPVTCAAGAIPAALVRGDRKRMVISLLDIHLCARLAADAVGVAVVVTTLGPVPHRHGGQVTAETLRLGNVATTRRVGGSKVYQLASSAKQHIIDQTVRMH